MALASCALAGGPQISQLKTLNGDAVSRLVHDGLNPKSISVAGRGELDLAVPTPNGVHEPRNPRVEITVR